MPEPFVVAVPQSELDDLADRLRRTRWPDALDGSGWDLGTDRVYLQELCAYWADGFDRRRSPHQRLPPGGGPGRR